MNHYSHIGWAHPSDSMVQEYVLYSLWYTKLHHKVSGGENDARAIRNAWCEICLNKDWGIDVNHKAYNFH